MDFLTNPATVTLLLFLWGLAVKYLPALKNLPNRLIPWFNLVLAVIAKLVSPEPAEAGGFFSTISAGIGWLWPPIQVVLARLIYETWARPTMEMAAPKIEKKATQDPDSPKR